jgi:NADH-quinone oxidoreductase subunit N
MLLAAAVLVLVCVMGSRYDATVGAIAVDRFRWMMDVVILAGTIFTIALAIDDNERTGITAPESHVLVLLASSGMMLLAGARDLMVVFLGIELMSVSVYALAGMNRRSERSAEGALKYFLLGAFSTAFLLYGMSLVYGATGSTSLPMIGQRIIAMGLVSSPVLAVGIGLMLVGFGFKVAAVPFHMWAPDVYDGSPSPITAYMAATVKAAAFAAFLRVWLEAFPASLRLWHPALAGLAIATMIVGNAIGLRQKNIKRMLAYSSIGHAGYITVAIAAGTFEGASAMVFHLFAYTLATFGAFAVICAVAREGEGTVMIGDLDGLWSVRPWLAFGMSVTMLSLLGFPIFGGAGFVAKWYILRAAIQSPLSQTALIVVLVLTTVISAGYYMRVVMAMFMQGRREGAAPPLPTGGWTRGVLVCCVALLLIMGVVPGIALPITSRSIPALETVTPAGGPHQAAVAFASPGAPPGSSGGMRAIR